MSGRHWLLSLAVCAAGISGALQAQQPPPQTAPPPNSSAAAAPDAPDEDFIEFLGSDDVGDAAWWEFLKRAPSHGEDSPPPPPPDARR